MTINILCKNLQFIESISECFKKHSIKYFRYNSVKEFLDNGLEMESAITIIEISPQISSYETVLDILSKRRHSILITSDNLSNSLIVELLLKGADDFFHINTNSQIVFAKIMAHMRRLEGLLYPKDRVSTHDGKIILNRISRTVDIKDNKLTKSIQLSQKEFDILYLLVENEGHPVKRDLLLTKIWKDKAEKINSQTLDKYVQMIRQKLNSQGKRIKTIYAMGYLCDKTEVKT